MADDHLGKPIDRPEQGLKRIGSVQKLVRLEPDARALADYLDRATTYHMSSSGEPAVATYNPTATTSAQVKAVVTTSRLAAPASVLRREINEIWGAKIPAGSEIIAPTARHLQHFGHPSWKLLDIDRPKYGGKVFETADEVRALLVGLLPELGEVPMVIKASTSSFTWKGDRLLRGAGGWHVWILFADGTRFKEFTKQFAGHCISQGVHWPHITKSGAIECRSPADTALANETQPIFIGGAIISTRAKAEGYRQERPPAAVYQPHGAPFSGMVPAVDAQAVDAVQQSYRQNEQLVAIAAPRKEAHQAYLRKKGVIQHNSETFQLSANTVLHFDRAGEVTVADVLESPHGYVSERGKRVYLADPLDDKHERSKALLNRDRDGRLYVFSFKNSCRFWLNDISADLENLLPIEGVEFDDFTTGLPVETQHVMEEDDHEVDHQGDFDPFHMLQVGGRISDEVIRLIGADSGMQGLAADLALMAGDLTLTRSFRGKGNQPGSAAYGLIQSNQPQTIEPFEYWGGEVITHRRTDSFYADLLRGPENITITADNMDLRKVIEAVKETSQGIKLFVFALHHVESIESLCNAVGVKCRVVYGRTAIRPDGSRPCMLWREVEETQSMGIRSVLNRFCLDQHQQPPAKCQHCDMCQLDGYLSQFKGDMSNGVTIYTARWAAIERNALIDTMLVPSVSMVLGPVSQLLAPPEMAIAKAGWEKVKVNHPELAELVALVLAGAALTEDQRKQLNQISAKAGTPMLTPGLDPVQIQQTLKAYKDDHGVYAGAIAEALLQSKVIKPGAGHHHGGLVIESPVKKLSRIESDRIILASSYQLEAFTKALDRDRTLHYFASLEGEPIKAVEVANMTVKKGYWSRGSKGTPPKLGSLRVTLAALVMYYAQQGEAVAAAGHDDILADLPIEGLLKLPWWRPAFESGKSVGLMVVVSPPKLSQSVEHEPRTVTFGNGVHWWTMQPVNADLRSLAESYRAGAVKQAIEVIQPKRILSLTMPPLGMPSMLVNSIKQVGHEDVLQDERCFEYAPEIVKRWLDGASARSIAADIGKRDEQTEKQDKLTSTNAESVIKRFLNKLAMVVED